MTVISSRNLRKRIERSRPPNAKKTLSIKDFYEKRNNIVITRGVGGLGDVLMHRMIFEDFKRLAPDIKLHFSCPKVYHDAVIDHPFLDKVLDVKAYDIQDYLVSYMTTTACGRYEMNLAPYSGLHRSDIWAQHCGLTLTNHNMHIQLTDEEKQKGRDLIESHRDRSGPSVMISPMAALHNKDILEGPLTGVINGLHERGYYVFGLHTKPIPTFMKNKIPSIAGINLRQWLAIIHQSDYAISVDSAAFHAAGGMGKPLVGIFTFINAETYSKYCMETTELVQGECPKGYAGCYNWGTCPFDKPLPCQSNITAEQILASFNNLVQRF